MDKKRRRDDDDGDDGDGMARGRRDGDAETSRASVFRWTLDRAALGRGAGNDHANARRVYASGVTPNATCRVCDFPDVAPRKFTNDGSMLLCVSRHQQELVGYAFRGMRACLRRDKRGEVVASEATERAMGSFWSYFEEKWTTHLSDGDDAIVKDFMLEVYDGEYIVAASATPLDGSSVAAGGAMREDEDGAPARAAARARGRRGTETQETSGGISGAPSMQRIVLHLVRTKTGEKLDSFTFRDDFMHLPRNGAVSLRGDTLAVLSMKHQRVIFLRVHEEGRFEEVASIGEHITNEDKETVAAQDARERAWMDAEPQAAEKARTRATGFAASGRSMLTGLTQRLVTSLYHDARRSSSPDALRLLHRNFERYVSLVMLRVRILDANLLLIKFGTPEYALARRGDNVIGPTMYGVFDLSKNAFTQTATSMSDTNGMVDEELNAPPRGDFPWARFAGSQGEALAVCNTSTAEIDDDDEDAFNTIATRLFRTQDYPPQFRSLSPYFDKRLFSYDERTITAIDRLQPHVDFGIKFVSAQQGQRRRVSFKLMLNNSLANNGRSKRRVQYVFHPVYPFAMSISIAYMQPTLVNFHVRSAPGDELLEITRAGLL
jgi:de-etiolated-1